MIRSVVRSIAGWWTRTAGDIVIFGGLALIAFGAFEIYQPAGFIVAGVELAALGWLLDRR